MIEAIEQIRTYTKGMDAAAFVAQRMVIDAVVRNFLILGEAAKYVPQELHRHYTEAPWRLVTDLRNRAIHDYPGVDAAILWSTIQRNLPGLDAALHRMLAELDNELSG